MDIFAGIMHRIAAGTKQIVGPTGDPAAAIAAGMVAGLAFVATMETEFRVGGRRLDDLVLLGRPLAKDQHSARRIGLAIHFFNSAGLALLYARFADRLPGPLWFRGALFANLENTVIYPSLSLEEYHPAVRNGEIDRYFSWRSYWQSVPRHVVYGVVVGILYDRIRRDPS